MKLRHTIMVFLVAGLVLHTVYYYPLLPTTLASHFNRAGEPDAWMGKSAFLVFEGILICVLLLEFLALPWLVERMPDRLINLPNKAYWLAPEHRSRAFAIFRKYFQWFGIALLTLLFCVSHLVFRANITRTELDKSIWLFLAVYFVFVVIWLVKFILVFKRTS